MAGAHSPDHRILPEWLRHRAAHDGASAALRYKRRGRWREQSWGALATAVGGTAAVLRDQGFSVGDRLLVDAPPVPAVFRHCLAAWWLGGGVIVHEAFEASNGVAPARFALAGSEAARARLEAVRPALGPYRLAVQLEGSAELAPGWRSGDALAPPGGAAPAIAATGDAVALIRHTARAGEGLAPAGRRSVTHAELVDDARALVASDAAGTRALAGRALSLGAQLECVLGAWLVGGLALGFVEDESTEHGDRRELEPSLLFDTADGYAALVARIQANLPLPESRERRWLDRALDGTPRLGRRLITSRLRSVVGFGGARRAVVIGGGSEPSGLERLLGIPVLEWPARRFERGDEVFEQSPGRGAGLELAHTGSEVA